MNDDLLPSTSPAEVEERLRRFAFRALTAAAVVLALFVVGVALGVAALLNLAHDIDDTTTNTNRLVEFVEGVSGPEAARESAARQEALVRRLVSAVDCNNAQRLAEVLNQLADEGVLSESARSAIDLSTCGEG